MSKTLFEKICDLEIPSDIVYEDEYCVAFKDINPQAPFHVQLVPRKPITMLASASPEDPALLGQLLLTAPTIAATAGFEEAFRIATKNADAAGQSVFNMHLHKTGRASGRERGGK